MKGERFAKQKASVRCYGGRRSDRSPSLPPSPPVVVDVNNFIFWNEVILQLRRGREGTGDNERSEISAPDYVLFSLSSLKKKKKKKRRSIDRSLSSSSSPPNNPVASKQGGGEEKTRA